MAPLFFLLGAALLGVGLVRSTLRSLLTRAEQGLWGMVIGWAFVTAVTYITARLSGHLTIQSIWMPIVAAWIGIVALWCPTLSAWHTGGKGIERWRRDELVLIALLCLFGFIYVPLFDSHMLKVGTDGALYSGGGSAVYDIPFHSAVSTSFAYGDNFAPVYTPMSPAPLLYPSLPDFLTAVLLVLGCDLHTALVATAIPLALALIGIFYSFALRLSDFVLPVS